jgi:flavin-dependent dehydrogenase
VTPDPRQLRVAIIGGGPAGASAAIHLARSGAHATILESREFPRTKVCGEFISPAATDELESVLPASTLLKHGARQVDHFRVECGHRSAEWRTPRSAWSISRDTLDTLLLNEARRAGALIRQPCTVREVQYGAAGVTLITSNNDHLTADVVIHADGSGRHDPAGPVKPDPNLIAHKCHLRAPPGLCPGVLMRSAPGAYVGFMEVENGLSTCALVATRERSARFAPNLDALLSHLWPAFDPAWRTSEWLSCGVPRSAYTDPGHPRSFRVGNAAAAVDPVGGEGIGLALWSGRCVAQVLARGLALGASDAALRSAQREVASLYRARLRTRLITCRATGALLIRPRLVSFLWPLVSRPSLGLRPWYRLSGKPASRPVEKSETRPLHSPLCPSCPVPTSSTASAPTSSSMASR